MMSEYAARDNLEKVLAEHLPKKAAETITRAITDYVDAVRDDLRDKIGKRGMYDPDY